MILKSIFLIACINQELALKLIVNIVLQVGNYNILF